MRTHIKTLSRDEAMALGFVPHPLISERRVKWNRFYRRLVLFVTFGRMVPTVKVPPRPPWSIEVGGTDELGLAPDEEKHVQFVVATSPAEYVADPEGIASANRLMGNVDKFLSPRAPA